MSPGARIDYEVLRGINPESAHQAVLEYLNTNGGNTADTAWVFGINCRVVNDVLKKTSEYNLRDRPKSPKHQLSKTASTLEKKVVATRNKT